MRKMGYNYLIKRGIGTKFYDEETDKHPYTVKKVVDGNVYAQSFVDSNKLIKVPKDHEVFVE